MLTLSLIFNKDKTQVLMCYHRKFQAMNFVGGKVHEDETDYMEAAYREVFEETGITKEDVALEFIRKEEVTVNPKLYEGGWGMHVTAGVLNKDVTLVEEKNELFWIDINATDTYIEAFGNGNCLVFLNEAKLVLGIK